MALLLRRGTQAERDAITPAEGELIYTTDTKRLYAGDGATLGGVLVSADAATTLNSLTDTDLTGASNGDHLAYNSGTSKWEPTNAGAGTIGNLSDVNGGYVNGDLLQFDGLNFVPKTIDELLIWDNSLTANLTGNTTGLHTGPVDGDVIGSVFADDSTLMVDGVNAQLIGSLTTNKISSISNIIQLEAALDNQVQLELVLQSNTDLSASNADRGKIFFVRDDINGKEIEAILGGGRAGVYLNVLNSSDAFTEDGTLILLPNGDIGAGTYTPAEKLDVRGNIVASGTIQPGVYADTTARDAAHATPSNGQMIYLTATHKFQGYANGAWADLN